jgi:hypothetical protein
MDGYEPVTSNSSAWLTTKFSGADGISFRIAKQRVQTLDADVEVADSVQSESPEANPYVQALGELEVQTRKLDEAFAELERLIIQEQQADSLFQESCTEEQQILQSESSERESVKALIQIRAQRDLRGMHLANVRKRVSFQQDGIAFDVGQDTRRAFAHFSFALLQAKEGETLELFRNLFPVESLPPGVDHRTLVQSCRRIIWHRQVSNWCSGQSNPDQQQELEQLRELPGRWLVALRRLIEGKDPFDRTSV